jgi:hypothetical protein
MNQNPGTDWGYEHHMNVLDYCHGNHPSHGREMLGLREMVTVTFMTDITTVTVNFIQF